MAKEKATIAATLGHEYEDLEEREDFLANNADSVEKMEFVKRFNSDELMKKKDLFALQSARASDIEEEIKDFREQKKEELKPIFLYEITTSIYIRRKPNCKLNIKKREKHLIRFTMSL